MLDDYNRELWVIEPYLLSILVSTSIYKLIHVCGIGAYTWFVCGSHCDICAPRQRFPIPSSLSIWYSIIPLYKSLRPKIHQGYAGSSECHFRDLVCQKQCTCVKQWELWRKITNCTVVPSKNRKHKSVDAFNPSEILTHHCHTIPILATHMLIVLVNHHFVGKNANSKKRCWLIDAICMIYKYDTIINNHRCFFKKILYKHV